MGLTATQSECPSAAQCVSQSLYCILPDCPGTSTGNRRCQTEREDSQQESWCNTPVAQVSVNKYAALRCKLREPASEPSRQISECNPCLLAWQQQSSHYIAAAKSCVSVRWSVPGRYYHSSQAVKTTHHTARSICLHFSICCCRCSWHTIAGYSASGGACV